MLNILHKRRLVEKGMACGKTRRTVSSNPFSEALQSGWFVRSLILLCFVAGLALLIFTNQQIEPVKKFLLCLLIFFTAIAQLWINHPQTFAINSRLGVLLGVLLVQLSVIKLLLFQAAAGNIDITWVPLIAPYAFAPLVLSVLLGKNHGLFAAVFTSLWGSMLIGSIDSTFLVISLITGFIAVSATIQVRKRIRLFWAGFCVGLATWVLAAAFGLIGPVRWESLGSTDWKMIGFQSLAAIATGLVTAILAGGVIPVLENLFNITTDISWLEKGDLNHPLLKRMSLEAPGTYHHSLAVANLAEAAAEAVDANPTICRACAYFHDIGKLIKPQYFTENMSPGVNPHDDLTPTMSALVIIAHVKEGVDLALKNKLNSQIVEVIQQHHGTSTVSYFHQRALQQQGDVRLGGKIMNMREEDVPDVHEESFRYPGPKVQTKEAALISLADAIESASRSMERPTPQRIEDLVNTIVEDRIAEHQLDDCPLTLAEIRRAAESFRFTLLSMMHARIAYPRREEKESSAPEKPEQKSAA